MYWSLVNLIDRMKNLRRGTKHSEYGPQMTWDLNPVLQYLNRAALEQKSVFCPECLLLKMMLGLV